MNELEALLKGARETISGLRSCWLVTRGPGGAPGARPMGPLPMDRDSFDIRFLVDRRTGKSRDVALEPMVGLIFQRGEEGFVSLEGQATLLAEPPDVAARWRPEYEAYIPRGEARDNAAFIEVRASRMLLWIRGVTPEPFGMRTTELRRGPDGAWTLAR